MPDSAQRQQVRLVFQSHRNERMPKAAVLPIFSPQCKLWCLLIRPRSENDLPMGLLNVAATPGVMRTAYTGLGPLEKLDIH